MDEIMKERSAVYGDAREMCRFIAQSWAGLLHPHAEAIAAGEPIPEHVVALMLGAMKMQRMRLVFHEDNYDDLHNYVQVMAKEWQSESTLFEERTQ